MFNYFYIIIHTHLMFQLYILPLIYQNMYLLKYMIASPAQVLEITQLSLWAWVMIQWANEYVCHHIVWNILLAFQQAIVLMFSGANGWIFDNPDIQEPWLLGDELSLYYTCEPYVSIHKVCIGLITTVYVMEITFSEYQFCFWPAHTVDADDGIFWSTRSNLPR